MSFATERGKGFFVREYEELGKSISRIAKEQSVTSTTIRKALISYNIERRQTSKLSDHEKETILSMTESGHSVVEISNVISRSQQAVRSVLSPQQRIKPPIDKHTLYEEYVDNGMSGPELASLIGFNNDDVDKYHLDVFCTVGTISDGFDQLLDHFMEHHNWHQICTYKDMRFNIPHILYRNHHFLEEEWSEPNRFYSKGSVIKSHDPRSSEGDAMILDGWVPVYDCGTSKYILNNSNYR